mgnify:CR=1 FL=1
MKNRNTLSLKDKYVVVSYLTENKEHLKLLSLKALSAAVHKKTGILIDPATIGCTYRSAADYPPLVEARKEATGGALEKRIEDLEKRIADLEGAILGSQAVIQGFDL